MDAVSRLSTPMPRLRLSRIADLECQQNVAGQAAPAANQFSTYDPHTVVDRPRHSEFDATNGIS